MVSFSIRSIAQSYIRAAIAEGLKAEATWETLSTPFRAEYGQFYRRVDFLADYHTWARVESLRVALQSVRLDFRPGKQLFSEDITYLTRRFRYDVDVTVRLKGREFIMPTSVSSHQWLTPREMRDEAVEGIKRGLEPESELEIIKALQTAAYHRPEELWD